MPRVAFMQDLKLAALWAVLAGLSAAALIPYQMQLMPGTLAKIGLPLPAIAALQAAQAFVLIGLMALLGLRMGHRVSLGSPLLHGWLNLRQQPDWRALRPLQAILFGIAVAAIVVAVATVVDPLLPKPVNPPTEVGAAAAALNGFLASFYGGIAEELQLRLFLMTLLVWIVAHLRKSAPPAWVYWGAIIFAALLFGIGHLPAAKHLWGLNALVVLSIVSLNALAGLAFGWLYWKRGIEMAVVAHFSADIVLHVLAPLAGSGAIA